MEPKVLLQGYGYSLFCSHSARCLEVLAWQYFEEAFCAPKVRLKWYSFKGVPSHSSHFSGSLFPTILQGQPLVASRLNETDLSLRFAPSREDEDATLIPPCDLRWPDSRESIRRSQTHPLFVKPRSGALKLRIAGFRRFVRIARTLSAEPEAFSANRFVRIAPRFTLWTARPSKLATLKNLQKQNVTEWCYAFLCDASCVVGGPLSSTCQAYATTFRKIRLRSNQRPVKVLFPGI